MHFEKKLEKRSVNVDFNKLKDLDIQNREFIQKKETLEKEKKDISKSKDKSLFAKSKEISKSIDEISEKQQKIKLDLENILSNIPNTPHSMMFLLEKMKMIILRLVNQAKYLNLISIQSHIMK